MKKLVIVLAMFGLMFNVIGCKAKKAQQEETEIVENADVEKIEAEDATFSGDQSIASGPVDESLQAALGETPPTEGQDVSTEVVQTPIDESGLAAPVDEFAAAPVVDENNVNASIAPVDSSLEASNQVNTEITETPTVESTPSTEIAQIDTNLSPDLTLTEGTNSVIETPMASETQIAQTENNAQTNLLDAPITESPITESPVIASNESESIVETPVEKPAPRPKVKKSTKSETSLSSLAAVSQVGPKTGLRKLAEAEPYAFGNGFVNTVYIARPKEDLSQISLSIFGSDKSAELKEINSFLRNKSVKAGDKVFYVSPNRPTDSAKTISFYEDTGMIASTYTATKNENLSKLSKKLIGYNDGWKEIWTTNSISSKTKLAKGDSIQYWKPVEQITVPTTLANLDGQSKLVDSAQQMPEQAPPKELAQNTPPPAQELPPPPPMPEQIEQPMQQAAPPLEQAPPQELPPPPPPPQEIAAAPAAQQAPTMEEEAAPEGGLSSDLTMQLGGVAILVALLGFVLIRKNKKKKEAELASVEQTHVGT